jgi:transitional endoplasmic reticulum ATPase
VTEARALPDWAEDLRRRYLRGEASIFVLHGNVYDSVLSDGDILTLSDFLAKVLLKESKETVAIYNVATGVRFAKRDKGIPNLDDVLLQTEKPKILGAIERMLIGGTKTAVILE